MKHIVAFFYVGLAIVLAAKKNGEPIKVIHPSDQEQQQNPDVPQPLNGGSKGGKGKKDNDGILDDDEFDAYSNFVSKHKKGKSCGANGTAECKKRKGNFAKNFKKLKEYQKKATFEVNVNPTMDWSDEELKGRLMSKEAAAQFWSGKKNQGGRVIEKSRRKRSIPASFDWRTTGAVNDIKNQQSCGDCWAFASVASIEIIDNLVNCRTSNTTRVTYSEQQITDCTYASQQRDGCQGGGGPDALKYVIQNGITTSAAVPFTSGASGKGGACPSTINPKKMPIRDWMDLTNDVPGMMNFVATTAPIIVGMMVCNDFQLVYKSGVYDGSTNDNVNCGAHALTIIGYGTDTSGKDFCHLVRYQIKGDSYIAQSTNVSLDEAKTAARADFANYVYFFRNEFSAFALRSRLPPCHDPVLQSTIDHIGQEDYMAKFHGGWTRETANKHFHQLLKGIGLSAEMQPEIKYFGGESIVSYACEEKVHVKQGNKRRGIIAKGSGDCKEACLIDFRLNLIRQCYPFGFLKSCEEQQEVMQSKRQEFKFEVISTPEAMKLAQKVVAVRGEDSPLASLSSTPSRTIDEISKSITWEPPFPPPDANQKLTQKHMKSLQKRIAIEKN
ncbi:unnamed protein product, partial [Mesorhabditis belari]|uniref:Peptidase C1A papain C-terminal domain-containing protein n=1 Tax=Mesorhabditis belari TaxID=2138241 RepID=A0AAF3FMS9_9BILA